MATGDTRAVLYRRVSTTEQARNGLSLDAQLEQLRAEAERRGWDAEEVTDEGVSGSVPVDERPALGPALSGMREGDVLAVTRLDRLSRSVLDFADLLKRSRAEGWALVALDLGIDMTTHHGRLIAHMVVAVAEWEREMISARIKDGLSRSTKRLGRRPGLPPVGGGRPAEASEQVVAVVRDAREAGLSAGATARRLNAYGLASPRGKRWHAATVIRLLTRLD